MGEYELITAVEEAIESVSEMRDMFFELADYTSGLEDRHAKLVQDYNELLRYCEELEQGMGHG